jgi:hypothetical protein
MAYEYDRFEREDGGGSFLMGLLAGTVLGAGLGMLFAPRPGAELRTQLTDQATKLKTTAGGAYNQATERVTQMVDRGREAYDRARTSASEPGTAGSLGNTGSLAGTSYTGAGTTDRS